MSDEYERKKLKNTSIGPALGILEEDSTSLAPCKELRVHYRELSRAQQKLLAEYQEMFETYLFLFDVSQKLHVRALLFIETNIVRLGRVYKYPYYFGKVIDIISKNLKASS